MHIQERRGLISSVALCEIFLLISMSFAIAFLLSEDVGVVSAQAAALVVPANAKGLRIITNVDKTTGKAVSAAASSATTIAAGGTVPVGIYSTGTVVVDGVTYSAAAGAIEVAPSVAGTGNLIVSQGGKVVAIAPKSIVAGQGGLQAGATEANAFTFKGFIKDVFGGKAFGGGVTGALVQGLAWGALMYGTAKLLLPLFGADKETTDAAATALFVGGVSFGAIKATSLASGKGLFGLSVNQLGFFGGAAIAIVVFLLLYKKEKKTLVQIQCFPWEPPLGGSQCEECNKDPNRPCSEYRCKALGQACELENKGTQFEQCIWKSKFDVDSPVIRPWEEVLRPANLRYIPDSAVRPPKLGVKIVRGNNGCVEAFTPLEFGVTLNEPARCRVDYNHTSNFSQMQYPFGDNYLLYNHTLLMRLPGPGNESLESPLLQNDGTFTLYTRCMDANGNVNVDEFSFRFCVNKGPDTTPARIEKTSIIDESYVQYNVDQVPIEIYVNEPAECRWSIQSKAFEDMEHTMQCATDTSDANEFLLYTCRGNLTGIKNREDNTFYFRCLDQPGKPLNERTPMRESYPLTLKGSQPLIIDAVEPNGTIYGSTSAVKVTLGIATSNGAGSEGKSICSLSDTGAANSFIPFDRTNNYRHTQPLTLTNGTYSYFIRCVDFGSNAATTMINFSVAIDKAAPRVTRVYRDQALKIVTDEEAECRYSLQSCNFALRDGLKLEYANADTKTFHYIDWKPSTTYYVRCVDGYGNEPDPATCSVVVRPIEFTSEQNL